MADRPEDQGKSTGRNPPEAFRWKPGQSGNPKGRIPNLERFETIVLRVLAEKKTAPRELGLVPGKKLRREEIIARGLVAAAEAGDHEAQQIILARTWPKRDRLEIELPLDALADAEDALERRIQKAIASRRALTNGHADGYTNGHGTNGHAPDDAESP